MGAIKEVLRYLLKNTQFWNTFTKQMEYQQFNKKFTWNIFDFLINELQILFSTNHPKF